MAVGDVGEAVVNILPLEQQSGKFGEGNRLREVISASSLSGMGCANHLSRLETSQRGLNDSLVKSAQIFIRPQPTWALEHCVQLAK